MTEGDERVLLTGGQVLPPLRLELVRIGAPDLLAVVDAVGRNGKNGAGREVVSLDVHALGGIRRDLTGETDAGGGVVAEGFVDDSLQVRKVLDHVVGRHVNFSEDVGVELGLELLHDTGGADGVEEEGAGRVGGGVGAGDELGQGLGGEFFAAERLALFVAAFHQALQEILAGFGRGVVKAGLDAGDGDTGQVLDGGETLGEESVGDVLGEGLEGGVDAEGGGNLTAAVENLDSGRVDGRSIGRRANLGHIGAGGKHAEGLTKGEITDDVEGKVVEPLEAVEMGGLIGALGVLDHAVPLLDEEFQVGVHVGLELQDGLG